MAGKFFYLKYHNINSDYSANGKRFQLISPDSSNVHFANNITTNDSLNIFRFEYIYNGGGAATADFNNDGLPDLFFVGNEVPCRIYINKGNFHFDDITKSSGIEIKEGWPFGVCVIDINQDGLPDLYISIGGPGNKDIYSNKLFVNQGLDKSGNPFFKEMAEEYGLADKGQSIQALFFDYDHDGDLDMYLLKGGGFENSPIVPHPIIKDGSARNTDKLYRNDFDKKSGHPVFTDVSKQAGITQEGFGLGVSLLDINDDGWPDVYVTNDYLSNDQLYVNNRDGTFSEKSQEYFKHTSHFAMGNDAGDINNDGLIDIIAVDMLPEDHYNRGLMFGPNQYDKFYYAIQQGYSYQYMRNTLQLNRGNGKFSEIGQLAGIYKTSWSWSSLFADLDNDGYQDIFITNGFGKNVTDLDFVKYRSNLTQKGDRNKQVEILDDSLSSRPGIKTHPYAYKNNGDYTFSDSSKSWGLDNITYSNGAIYVDLDNDGDLDLVTNNIDEPAHIYRNNTIEKSVDSNSNFLKIKLKGTSNNKSAIGSKIDIKYGNAVQTRIISVVRGFESSVEPVAHFGLGKINKVDTILVHWPDGKQSTVTNVKSDQLLTIDYTNSKPVSVNYDGAIETVFKEVQPASLNINYKNKHNDFNEFNYERLLPKKYSQGGPPIAVGDVNGDGLEDFFVGGAYQQSGIVYIQNKNGSFTGHTLDNSIDWSEDAGALLFDADGDGDLDLFVVSGGNEFTDKNIRYQHRLYKNDSKGNFSKDEMALPAMQSSGSCVAASDYDGDGDVDLFIGGGVKPGFYPEAPISYLLKNNKGKFIDVTDSIAPGLRKIGMVNSALWSDIDNDGKPELIVVGEWIPISVFKNINGKFINITENLGLKNTEGWWQSIASGDFDNDGNIDFIVGNWGLNSPYKASVKEPLSVCYKDFDKDGKIDPILCDYENGINYPLVPWDYLIDQMPSLRKKIPYYASYAGLSMDKLLSLVDTGGMQTLNCKTLQSVFLHNNGNGKFTIQKLPVQAQLSPIYGMLAEDINHDGNLDLVAVGNFYGTDVVVGRYDASVGLIMYGDGKGNFMPQEISSTGFIADKDSKALVRIETADKRSLLMVSQNSDSIKIFKENKEEKVSRLQPLQTEVSATLFLKNGSKQKKEIGFGTSYLSQSSRIISITSNIKRVELYSSSGAKTRSFDFK